ncbi:DUF3307 domain-containing protein [Aerococcus agrisoli]|uniref:DUF3307 domain-containing protein n=1 Tax=Aerococcus agrisoli TaxID=2487350 RepID=A0A3N4GMQ0_9LACT|nr:DUF3307 domain-containing protein [Aerococcus agrisoli]RPA59850.1 DUF3307 domain-containing protein [Aerococcus agrisoli]
MMNNNEITLLLFIAHFLADYHLQSETLAMDKSSNYRSLAKHLGIHAIVLLTACLITLNVELLSLFASVWLSHVIIDHIKIYLQARVQATLNTDKYFYIADQILHIVAILYLSNVVFADLNHEITFLPTIYIQWLLLLVMVTKPANVTFKMLFSQYQNYEISPKQSTTVAGAGAMIGNLERILSAVFLSLNALSSIGLIYTAKSIARFKLIEESQGFAEYYLIGTLYSILFVLISYYLIF